MPLSFTFHPDEPIVTVTGDHASPDEWTRLLAKVTRDPRCEGGCAFLRDRRKAQGPLDVGTIMGIMEVIRRHCADVDVCRVAVLTRETGDVSAELADALTQSREIPLRAFASYEAAIEWLREGLRDRRLSPQQTR